MPKIDRAAVEGFLGWTIQQEPGEAVFPPNAKLVPRKEGVEYLSPGEVVFAVVFQRARLTDSTAEVRMRYASVNSQAGGVFERITNYTDIDEARAAAERLAQERG